MKGMSLEQLSKQRQRMVRSMLRKEFADFFDVMTKSTDRWPNISDQEMVDAIADALVELGKRRGLGAALLQTLVYELQDRAIDAQTK